MYYERLKMVREQIIARGITDTRVIKAMQKIPRHEFLPSPDTQWAYSDGAQSIAAGQTISQPYIVALMTELLQLTSTDVVLEVGTGSGYQSAVLAEIAHTVVTIERIEELYVHARDMLQNYKNVTCMLGDGALTYHEANTFDKIIITAATPKIKESWKMLLKPGGIIVVPEGSMFQQLYTIEKIEKQGEANPPATRIENNSRYLFKKNYVCDVRFVPLISDSI